MIRAVVARTLAVQLVAAAWSPRPVRADAVVGTGTAGSCTEAALRVTDEFATYMRAALRARP